MSPTKTAPGRAGRTCCRGSARRTPAGGSRRASAAGSEEPETATDVDRRRYTPRPVLRPGAAEGQRWRGAVDTLPDRVRIADAPPGESWPGEGGGDTGDTAPRGGKGQYPEVGQKGTPVCLGCTRRFRVPARPEPEGPYRASG